MNEPRIAQPVKAVGKKESRTDELFTLIENKIGALYQKLDKVLRPDSPEEADKKEETTLINKGLSAFNERLENLIKRIDL